MPWTLSTGDGIPYKSQNPVQVLSCQKNFNLKFCENEQNLMVYWNEEDYIENSSQEKSKEIICHVEGYSLDDLHFTGSEFDNVVLVTGRNIDTTSQEFLIVFYKIISRARKTLKVFSHPSNLADFKSLLTLSDTDVYVDKQRYDKSLSSRVFPNLPLMEKEEFRRLESSQSVVQTVHDEDPQSLFIKAFEAFFTADVNYLSSLMNSSASSLSKTLNFYPYGTSANRLAKVLDLMIDKNPSILGFFTRFEIFDLMQKMCAYFCNDTHLLLLHFPDFEDFASEIGKWTEIGQRMETSNFQAGDGPSFLNAEEFNQFLEEQAITSEKLFTNFHGVFLLLTIAIIKLNPDQFTEFLKSVGVDSLKLSDEQFLDDDNKNILMYCVVRTTHFCIVADWALKQDCLDEMLSQRNCDGETCFVLACKIDNFVLVKVLLQKYHYDWLRDGFDAILALCKNGNMLIFKHLLTTLKGDNDKMKLHSMRGFESVNILMITTQNTKMMETFLNFLIEEKLFDILLYEKDAMGLSCLCWAALFQNVESIKMLIERYKYNWKTGRYIKGITIAHIICLLETPNVLEFFVANYGPEFIEVAQELDYAVSSCLEVACLAGRSVEVVQMVLNSLNDSFSLPQNFTQLLRCLVESNEGSGENKNRILDCLVSHMLEKLSLGYPEDEIKQHYLVYASDSEEMLKIGVRILVGPEELEEADSGEPQSFSLGSWKCIFWAVTECKEIRILTNRPNAKMSAILERSEGSCINIFASWECLVFLMGKLADHLLPESCASTSFKSWDELCEKELPVTEKHKTRKCCTIN